MTPEEARGISSPLDPVDCARLREEMVATQLVPRGIEDKRVLEAMSTVPREFFIPPELARHAYCDNPLPIGGGQTISQPYIVAFMAEALALKPGDRVLEVGTGLGYAAAVMGRLCREVCTVERRFDLAGDAELRFEILGLENIVVRCGDGAAGWEEKAPFDAISVAAASPTVPKALLDQLDLGGRLILPLGPCEGSQTLTRITRVGLDSFRREPLLSVRFVPLV